MANDGINDINFDINVSLGGRFGNASAEEMEKGLRNDLLSDNTHNKIKWSENVYAAWAKEKRQKALEELKDVKSINGSLSQFVLEAKKENKQEYTYNSLYELVVCIQHALNEKNGTSFKLLKDSEFQQIQGTLDMRMKQLKAKGVGLKRKSAEVLSQDEIDTMWSKQILGCDEPKKLVETMIFLNGINFALRGRQEHRQLTWQNFHILVKGESKVLVYTETVSKNNPGGLLHRKRDPKTVEAYENKGKPERCPVNMFSLYKSKCPSDFTKPNDPFYLQPKKNSKNSVWYNKIPLGVHQLSGVVNKRCKMAGLTKSFTNHSLRASTATILYNNGVVEQQVQEVTGHRSLEALRMYKKTSDQQAEQRSQILQGNVIRNENIACNNNAPNSNGKFIFNSKVNFVNCTFN